MQCFLKSKYIKIELSMIKIGELLRKLWSLRSCFNILPPGALTPRGIEGAMKHDVSKHWCTLQWCASRGWFIAHENWTSWGRYPALIGQDLVGSKRIRSFGQTMISWGLDINRTGWSCPDLGPAWPKERVLSSLYILDILFLFWYLYFLWYSYLVGLQLCVACIMFDDVSTIKELYSNKTLWTGYSWSSHPSHNPILIVHNIIKIYKITIRYFWWRILVWLCARLPYLKCVHIGDTTDLC